MNLYGINRLSDIKDAAFAAVKRYETNITLKYVLNYFHRDLEKDHSCFLSFGRPKNDFDRSYFQHRLQMLSVRITDILLFNLISFITIVPTVIFFSFRKRHNTKSNFENNVIVSLECFNSPNIFPNELVNRYSIYEEKYSMDGYLRKTDVFFAMQILIHHPFAFWLNLRTIVKICTYRRIIDKYSPFAICVTASNTASCSLLTAYCERNRVKHIELMQGEMFSSVVFAFYRFSDVYVWDQYYVDIMIKLGASSDNFHICRPNFLYIKNVKPKNNMADYTYYLANEDEVHLMIISNLLRQLNASGYVVRCRPHFRWTRLDLVYKYFDNSWIENYEAVDIGQSLKSTYNAIALFSTVLFQAYLSDINVVLDDVSDKYKFSKLSKLGYIMINKENVILLSSLIKSKN